MSSSLNQAAVRWGAATVAVVLVLVLVLVLIRQSEASCVPSGGSSSASQPGASKDAEKLIPADYLRIYQLNGRKYGITWVYLAAMGRKESNHGRYTVPGSGVRSGANFAGAAGPMQIGKIPGSAAGDLWSKYKTDGNGDGKLDIYDPADAVPTAARILLEEKGYDSADPRTGIRKYNGAGPAAEAYADDVMSWAKRYAAGDFTTGAPSQAGAAPMMCAPGNLSGVIKAIVAFALAQRGKPYVWGATGPDAFDCSGLIWAAFKSVGIELPRTTFEQWPFGVKIPNGTEQPGDLVFFNSGPGTRPDSPGHVGLVVDPAAGTMVQARCSACVPGVDVTSYKKRSDLVGFTRPLARPEIAQRFANAGTGPLGGFGGGKSQITGNKMTPTMRAVLQELDAKFGPFVVIGCFRSTGDPQDHGRGQACDFMVSSGTIPPPKREAQGDRAAEYAVSNGARMGVKYVIWKQRIWNISRGDRAWRPMPDRGSITQNHFDHVHVSVLTTSKDTHNA
ncbi:NlpC/P60 family protein [Actinomadura kijaniata]|uniref:C40 family peptidase n=1 Tax=Actinomadura kijaniata TaxID=46161 RepID=UPI003F1D3465